MLIPIRNDLPSSGIEVRCSALRPIFQLFGSKERSEKKIGTFSSLPELKANIVRNSRGDEKSGRL